MSARAVVGALLATLVVAAVACSTTQLAPPAVDVSGNWLGTWQYDNIQSGNGDLRGTLQQSGQNLTGRFNVTGPVLNHVANVTGAVSGNDIVLTQPASGRLTVNGNQMTGYINGLSPAKVTLRKQ